MIGYSAGRRRYLKHQMVFGAGRKPSKKQEGEGKHDGGHDGSDRHDND